MEHLRSENEIISCWNGCLDKPMVSICCITYNHEAFIGETLEGFLKQETDFSYEILVHDDASEDTTAEIIRTYQSKYPRIIRPIYQTENRYSKGEKISFEYNFPRAKGKYIAMCEGDDFWSSPFKLERQVGILESDEGISMSGHAVSFLFDGVVEERKNYKVPDVITGEFSQIVSSGVFIALNSLVFRASLIEYPSWLKELHGGHKFLLYLMSAKGRFNYIDEVLAVKRRHSGGVTVSNKLEREEFYLDNNIILLKNIKGLVDKDKCIYVDKKLVVIYFKKAYRMLKLMRFNESLLSICGGLVACVRVVSGLKR